MQIEIIIAGTIRSVRTLAGDTFVAVQWDLNKDKLRTTQMETLDFNATVSFEKFYILSLISKGKKFYDTWK